MSKSWGYFKEYDSMMKAVEALHPPRMRMKVAEVRVETRTTKTFKLVRMDGEIPPFRAGQYVSICVNIDGVVTNRPYSISSPPTITDYIEVTVRRKPGGFVSHYLLDRVNVGEELEVVGPAGQFYYEPLTDGRDLVFIAGGSGITPFMSMILETVERNLPLNIWLIYGSRTPDDVIFGDRLEKIAEEHPNIHYSLVISEPPEGWEGLRGFITADIIESQVGSVEGKTFYLCGPQAMYSFCIPEIEKLGVPRRKIKCEAYGPPDDVTKEPGWPKGLSPDATFTVEVVGRVRKTFKARAGEPLLNSMEREGIVIPAVCRSGQCMVCHAKLVSGKVFTPGYVMHKASDAEFGYIHPCMSYPIENIKIKI